LLSELVGIAWARRASRTEGYLDLVTPEAQCRALTSAFFAAVSFERGGRPDYEALYGLFVVDGGRLIRAGTDEPDIATIEQFVASRLKLVESGTLEQFRETETGARTDVFGSVGHRLSTYAKSGISNGVPFAANGVISTQFVHTVAGWRMSSMAWDDERPGLTVPQLPAVAQ
jgi:hypothetical protein